MKELLFEVEVEKKKCLGTHFGKTFTFSGSTTLVNHCITGANANS